MIKAYLFSDITRQIDHTYYSLHGSTIGPSKFFYNLKDYKVSMLSLLDPFIYEVELYPESIVGCFVEVICSLAKNWNTTDLVVRLLENNYRIKGFDYSNKEFQKIITAKKIFLKDGFKTIE